MEIKVGEYIRTENGIIGKVFDEDSIGENGVCIDTTFLDEWGDETDFVKYEDIKKHSFEIIDLIEEGDYVNGYKVKEVYIEGNGKKIWFRWNVKSNDYWQGNKKIKSVVTKELFKLEEYIV